MEKSREHIKRLGSAALLVGSLLAVGGCDRGHPTAREEALVRRNCLYSFEERLKMYTSETGIPLAIRVQSKVASGFALEQESVVRKICLYGIFRPDLGDTEYLSEDIANRLLAMYGWRSGQYTSIR